MHHIHFVMAVIEERKVNLFLCNTPISIGAVVRIKMSFESRSLFV